MDKTRDRSKRTRDTDNTGVSDSTGGMEARQESEVQKTQSQNLLTYFFSFGAFAALAKAFVGEEFGQNPRDCGLNSGRASPPEVF